MKDQPEVARVNARLRTYNNSEEERAAIARVDNLVFDKVRYVETFTVENATSFMDKHAQTILSAAALAEEITALRYDLDERTSSPEEVAERYAILRARANETRAALQRDDKESTWHEEKLSDPYATYLRIVDRYPSLRQDLD